MAILLSKVTNGRLRQSAAIILSLALMVILVFREDYEMLPQSNRIDDDTNSVFSIRSSAQNHLHQRMLDETPPSTATTTIDNIESPQPKVPSSTTPKIPPFAFQQADTREPLILIGIFSTLSEKSRQRRQLIRNTWADQKTTNSKICSIQTFLKQYSQGIDRGIGSCELVFTFVIAAGDDETSPTEISYGSTPETKLTTRPPDWTSHKDQSNPYYTERDDVIYLNIQQRTHNECKARTWFKFASQYLPNHYIDYVGRMDDTSIIDPNGFVGFIRHNLHPYPYNQKVYGGHYADLSTCTAPPEVCQKALGGEGEGNNKFYMKDTFYFMSMDLAEMISQVGTKKAPPRRTGHEDIDIGLHIQSATCCIKTISLPVWAHYNELHHDEVFREKWGEVAERQ